MLPWQAHLARQPYSVRIRHIPAARGTLRHRRQMSRPVVVAVEASVPAVVVPLEEQLPQADNLAEAEWVREVLRDKLQGAR